MRSDIVHGLMLWWWCGSAVPDQLIKIESCGGFLAGRYLPSCGYDSYRGSRGSYMTCNTGEANAKANPNAGMLSSSCKIVYGVLYRSMIMRNAETVPPDVVPRLQQSMVHLESPSLPSLPSPCPGFPGKQRPRPRSQRRACPANGQLSATREAFLLPFLAAGDAHRWDL
jgi:hypothetical protein